MLQVEEIVEVGELDPESIHLPNVFVDRVILGKDYEKRIEVRMYVENILLVVLIKIK